MRLIIQSSFATGDNTNDDLRTLSNTQSLVESGNDRLKKGEWAKAVADFNGALRLTTNSPNAFFGRGVAYAALSEIDKAIQDFGRVVDLDPTNAMAYVNRGCMYRIKGQFDKAIEDYDRCLRVNPSSYHGYKERAVLHSMMNESDKAIADATESLRLNPKDTVVMRLRAFCYTKIAAYSKAIEDYREAIRLEPKNSQFHNELAWLRATCPNASARSGKEAVELATQACELTGWSDWRCLDTLAAGHAEAGDFNSAVECQKNALSIVGLSDADRQDMTLRLSLYERAQPYREAEKRIAR